MINDIDSYLYQYIDQKRKFAVGLIDLDNFVPFLNKFGLEKGKELVNLVLDVVKEAIREKGNFCDIIKHIEYDSVCFITSIEAVEEVCQAIVSQFDQRVREFYSDLELQRGYVVSKDRAGEIKTFPIITVSIAVVTNKRRKFIHPIQIITVLNRLLVFLKRKFVSSYVIDSYKV